MSLKLREQRRTAKAEKKAKNEILNIYDEVVRKSKKTRGNSLAKKDAVKTAKAVYLLSQQVPKITIMNELQISQPALARLEEDFSITIEKKQKEHLSRISAICKLTEEMIEAKAIATLENPDALAKESFSGLADMHLKMVSSAAKLKMFEKIEVKEKTETSLEDAAEMIRQQIAKIKQKTVDV